ncbi:MAG: prepilin peptidase [Candidatus Eremiobacteraeota bacterium]|nr:prepilin peptidase [Candidatus Eremiobacteraeota bacterium]MBV8499285.1 prepilin peptidase [Candidatus Eremiobacteraeota bacterium]
MSVAVWLTLAGCCAAAFCDVRSRRIPNWLTGSLALAALAVHALDGWKSLAVALAVMSGLTLLGTLVYARGGIGGGDVKLAISGSGLLSYPLFIPFLLYTAIAGGALAVIYLAFRPGSRPSLARTAVLAAGGLQGLPARRETLPYALAFAIGAIFVALSQSIAPFLRINLS